MVTAMEPTTTSSPTRISGNGAAATSTGREPGLLPSWMAAGANVSTGGAAALFGTLQDLRAETRQVTEAWLRLAQKIIDRVDTFASTALSAAERATRAPIEVLQ
jgi:hypothetical protein